MEDKLKPERGERPRGGRIYGESGKDDAAMVQEEVCSQIGTASSAE